MAMMGRTMLPKHIYRLSSPNGNMSTVFREKSFFVGFLLKEHPMVIQRRVCEISKVELVDHVSDQQSILRIEKKININKGPLMVTATDFKTFMSAPFVSHTGIALVYDILNETPDEYFLDVQLLEADFDPKLCSAGLDTLI